MKTYLRPGQLVLSIFSPVKKYHLLHGTNTIYSQEATAPIRNN